MWKEIANTEVDYQKYDWNIDSSLDIKKRLLIIAWKYDNYEEDWIKEQIIGELNELELKNKEFKDKITEETQNDIIDLLWDIMRWEELDIDSSSIDNHIEKKLDINKTADFIRKFRWLSLLRSKYNKEQKEEMQNDIDNMITNKREETIQLLLGTFLDNWWSHWLNMFDRIVLTIKNDDFKNNTFNKKVINFLKDMIIASENFDITSYVKYKRKIDENKNTISRWVRTVSRWNYWWTYKIFSLGNHSMISHKHIEQAFKHRINKLKNIINNFENNT